MRKLLLGGIAASLLILVACKDNKQPASDDILKAAAKSTTMNAGTGNFDIGTPSGWQRIDTTIGGIKVTLLMAPLAPGANAQTNVNVVSESMNNASPDNYFDLNVTNMGKYMQNFSSSGKGDKEINGIKAKWIQYSQISNGLSLDAICYIIPSNGIAYVITCTAAKGQLERYRSRFDEVVGSFRVHQ